MSLTVRADRELCVGAGMCVRTAPDLFDQDDQLGYVVLLNARPTGAALEAARRAVDLCPSGALSVGKASVDGDANAKGDGGSDE